MTPTRQPYTAILLGRYAPVSDLNVWQWNEANVDFARVPSYDTMSHAPYSADLLPFWKEPAECMTDPMPVALSPGLLAWGESK